MPASIRLYLDEDVNPQVAALLTAQGIDTLTTRDTGKLHSTDEEQLAFATEQGRALFTHNVRDFAALCRRCNSEGRHDAGVLYAAQQPPPMLARMMREVCLLYPSLDDLVIWLPALDQL